MFQEKLNYRDKTTVDKELLNLYKKIQECRNCNLCYLKVNSYRPHIKLGSKAILVISQNPSIYRTGDPYVYGGLDKILNSLPPARGEEFQSILDKVYITNVVKCSTPNNRAPIFGEVRLCFPWLKKEVNIISPQKIIVLGSIAKNSLQNKFNEISKKFLEHPISALRKGSAYDYSYKFEEAVIE